MWHYCVETFETDAVGCDAKIEELLNGFGADGWELVDVGARTVYSSKVRQTFVFKRFEEPDPRPVVEEGQGQYFPSKDTNPRAGSLTREHVPEDDDENEDHDPLSDLLDDVDGMEREELRRYLQLMEANMASINKTLTQHPEDASVSVVEEMIAQGEAVARLREILNGDDAPWREGDELEGYEGRMRDEARRILEPVPEIRVTAEERLRRRASKASDDDSLEHIASLYPTDDQE